MRLDRVYIDGFKNLTEVEADFDETRLTTVIIGQNGAGKRHVAQTKRWSPRQRTNVAIGLPCSASDIPS
jgi:predicted ATP-binding protein involved in virulence